MHKVGFASLHFRGGCKAELFYFLKGGHPWSFFSLGFVFAVLFFPTWSFPTWFFLLGFSYLVCLLGLGFVCVCVCVCVQVCVCASELSGMRYLDNREMR